MELPIFDNSAQQDRIATAGAASRSRPDSNRDWSFAELFAKRQPESDINLSQIDQPDKRRLEQPLPTTNSDDATSTPDRRVEESTVEAERPVEDSEPNAQEEDEAPVTQAAQPPAQRTEEENAVTSAFETEGPATVTITDSESGQPHASRDLTTAGQPNPEDGKWLVSAAETSDASDGEDDISEHLKAESVSAALPSNAAASTDDAVSTAPHETKRAIQATDVEESNEDVGRQSSREADQASRKALAVEDGRSAQKATDMMPQLGGDWTALVQRQQARQDNTQETSATSQNVNATETLQTTFNTLQRELSGTPTPVKAEPGDAQSLKQIDQIRVVQRVARAIGAAQQQGGPIRLRLRPPELGSLQLEVTMEQGSLRAKLEADTQMARSVLLDNLPQLRDRLTEQGIRIEQFDIDVAQHDSDSPNQSWEQNLQDHPQSPTSETEVTRDRVATAEGTDPDQPMNIMNRRNLNVLI